MKTVSELVQVARNDTDLLLAIIHLARGFIKIDGVKAQLLQGVGKHNDTKNTVEKAIKLLEEIK